MTLGLGLGTFLVSLDFAIANVSIPNIPGDLAVSPSQGTWAITSFAAANAIALPLTGWLAQRFGEVRLFVASGVLFTIASLLCGLAPDMNSLILFRILQGVVSGPMLPLSQAILLHHFPLHLKGLAMAVVSMAVTVAPLTGPIIGGAITDNLSWPWIFFINVPLGMLAAALVWFTIHKHDTPSVRIPMDRVGLALLVIGVAALQVLLDKGREVDWFESTFAIYLGVLAALAIAYFIVWELSNDHPVVNLRLFGDRNFLIGVIGTSLPWGAVMAGMVVFPLWLQTNMGYTATWAGVAAGAVGVFIMLFTPFVGRFLTRLNLKYLLTVSFFLLWFSMLLGSRMSTEVSIWTAAFPRLVQGMALGLFFVPLLTIALSNMPQKRMASATGLFYFTRTLAGSIGVSIGITFWDRRTSFHHARLAEVTDPTGATDGRLQELLFRLQELGPAGFEALERLLSRQANMLATNDFFYAVSWMLPPILMLLWFARPPFKPGGRG